MLAVARDQENHWVAIGDLMSGLMMIFLLLAVSYMMRMEAEQEKIKKIITTYEQVRDDLYQDLTVEFKSDLELWQAEINQDLSVKFYNTEVLFERGQDDLNPKFQAILKDFFQRYVAIVLSPAYREHVMAIRIEGHTSSDWYSAASVDEAYINNMSLSQDRTRSALAYLLGLPYESDIRLWLRQKLRAIGLSSSSPIIFEDGTEDVMRSRRVEFRIVTDADQQLAKLMQRLK